MKFNKVARREFKAIGVNPGHSDYIGEGSTTKEVKMLTGYRGRGLQMLEKTFASGTPVKFRLEQYQNRGVIYTDLEITAVSDRVEYKTHHRLLMDLDSAADLLGLNKLAIVYRS